MKRNLAASLVLAQVAACAGILGLEPGVARDDPDGATTDAPSTEAAPPDGTVTYHALNDAARWSRFSMSSLGSPGGFWGGAFDGKYVYFAPFNNGLSTEVVRHDTTGPFSERSSWELQALGDYNMFAGGFLGAVHGGDRVFFVPFLRNFGPANTPFNSTVAAHRPSQLDGGRPDGGVASWEFFDTTVVGGRAGYCGGGFDGRYLYVSPHGDINGPHGVVAQYDTQAPFAKGTSWQAFNLATVAASLRGYCGMVFDGRFLYLAPTGVGAYTHGDVVRFDTKASFIIKTSWSSFDLASLNANAITYVGGAFDGRYVYFVPADAERPLVARYDTQAGSFDAGAGAWALFSLSTVSPVAAGFNGAAFDGRYLYLVPSVRGVLVRYDTLQTFDSASSWETYDLPSNVDGGAFVYHGATFDGRYLYLVPDSGNVLRFDAREPPSLSPFNPGSFL